MSHQARRPAPHTPKKKTGCLGCLGVLLLVTGGGALLAVEGSAAAWTALREELREAREKPSDAPSSQPSAEPPEPGEVHPTTARASASADTPISASAPPAASVAAAPPDASAQPSAPPPEPAPGEPVIVETVHRYDIRGKNVGELIAELETLGPVDASGSRFDGMTNWSSDWSWTFSPTGRCGHGPPRVTMTIDQTLPRWADEDGAPAFVVQNWDRYLRALETHENGHRDNARAAARDMQHELERLAAGSDCATLDAAADQAVQTITDRADREDVLYDARTDHGSTQGAHFP